MDRNETRQHIARILARHVESEGFCKCCNQPWPCDLRVVRELTKEGK